MRNLESSYLLEGLAGQHVAVVGGGSGIGRATTELCVRLGANVTISSRNQQRLLEVSAEIGEPVRPVPLDMTDPESVDEWADQMGVIDHLVISASSAIHGSFAGTHLRDVRSMFDAKFFGPYHVAKAALPSIREGGSITFFSGVLSRRPGMNCSGLGAVNGAVEALARGLALELGPVIRVNCLSPGMVRSEAYAKLDESARETMYQSTGESLPTGRVGETRELAEAAIYLMTNRYTTGVVLDVDGGHMIRQYATR